MFPLEETHARILVVDDEVDLEEIIRWKFRTHTRDRHWRFEFARDGREALDRVQAGEAYDVVVTDIRMPVMDGIALMRELRAANSDQVSVVVSAYSDMTSIRRAMNEGAFDFVTKPIDPQDLERTLARSVEMATRLKEARRVAIERLEAEAASQAKSRFLADMSHELRTPLNAVVLYCELVMQDVRDLAPPQVLVDLGRILAAARHLRTLIADILDLCRIEARKIGLCLENFAVRDLVGEVAGVLEQEFSQNGNQFTWSVADDVGRMRADPTRLRQGLYNVLGNAARLTVNGRVSLDVVRHSSDGGESGDPTGEEFVDFRVSDTGPGLTPEEIGRIFEPFTQGADARKHGGSGLGLAITRLLCDAMGGALTVESQPGQGAVFCLRIPVEVRWEAEVGC